MISGMSSSYDSHLFESKIWSSLILNIYLKIHVSKVKLQEDYLKDIQLIFS